MENIGQILTEVEYILNKMNEKYVKKIPQEILKFINQNKDTNYKFQYDDDKSIIENNLHTDTISILTYININFLLDSTLKEQMLELLKKDELIAEGEKKKQYNPDDIFKNKANKVIQAENTTMMVEYKESIFTKLKKWIKRNRW